ncbi:TPA: hypothetical protein HA238_05425 [Candidatus Micrarchaeota archaeon]|nr:hypothetical protein [Candidatus Micrarchaeota archaeon]
MMLFGKPVSEYIFPIKHYLLVSILIVISQYTIALPLTEKYPQYWFVINLTQIAWELMVAISVFTLIERHKFGLKNLFVVWILFSVLIHGLKITIRYFFYDRPVEYLIDRFSYGSLLVLAVVVGTILFAEFKRRGHMGAISRRFS